MTYVLNPKFLQLLYVIEKEKINSMRKLWAVDGECGMSHWAGSRAWRGLLQSQSPVSSPRGLLWFIVICQQVAPDRQSLSREI